MAWIEVHQALFTHRKTFELAELLDLPEVYASAHLIALWTWALDNAPDAYLPSSARTIARAAQYPSDAQAFVDALVRVGFIDEVENGWFIHDWQDYAGRLVEKRRANAERMKNARASNKEGSATHVQRTNNERAGATVPNPTEPNPTKQEESSAATPQAASVEPSPAPRSVLAVPKPPPKPKPKEKIPLEWPDTFDVGAVWVAIEDAQGYPPAWNYGRETLVVHALLTKHPLATPDDFAAFIAYRWKCFRGDPNAQPTFSEAPANFTSWLERGKPTEAVNQKDKNNGSRKPTRMDLAVQGIEEEYGGGLDQIPGYGANRTYPPNQAGYTPKRLVPPKSA